MQAARAVAALVTTPIVMSFRASGRSLNQCLTTRIIVPSFTSVARLRSLALRARRARCAAAGLMTNRIRPPSSLSCATPPSSANPSTSLTVKTERPLMAPITRPGVRKSRPAQVQQLARLQGPVDGHEHDAHGPRAGMLFDAALQRRGDRFVARDAEGEHLSGRHRIVRPLGEFRKVLQKGRLEHRDAHVLRGGSLRPGRQRGAAEDEARARNRDRINAAVSASPREAPASPVDVRAGPQNCHRRSIRALRGMLEARNTPELANSRCCPFRRFWAANAAVRWVFSLYSSPPSTRV